VVAVIREIYVRQCRSISLPEELFQYFSYLDFIIT
jgi:hypothetical protein